MRNKLTNFIQHTGSQNPYTSHIRVFRISILLYLLANSLYLWPLAESLYGPDSYFLPLGSMQNFILKALNLLEGPHLAEYWKLFVWAQILSILATLFLPYKKTGTLLVYFFTMNLYHKTIGMQNAGFNLLVMVLFMLLFMDENSEKTKSDILRSLQNTVSNFAVWAARFQIITLYAVATYYKLCGDTWLQGTAYYYVLYNDSFTLPWVQSLLIDNPFIIHLVSWFALGFQFFFPLLIWVKKTKGLMLLCGVFFHVCIIFLMGITEFGIIMLLMYLLFYVPDTKWLTTLFSKKIVPTETF